MRLRETVSPGAAEIVVSFFSIVIAVIVFTHVQAEAVDPSLKLYLPFDEGTGTTAFDVSGKENHGTLVNGSLWIPGTIGPGAVSFDGVNDYVEVAHPSTIELGASDWTFSAWANVTAFGKTRPLLSKSAPGSWVFPGKKIELGNGKLIFDAWGIGTFFSNASFGVGTWNHFAVTFNDATNEVKLYVNGVFDKTIVAALKPDNSSHVVRIGNRSAEWMQGGIDDVRFYSRMLSADEIAALAAGTPPAPDTTAPSISNVSAEGITAESATITWSTDEAADAQVEYGPTESYGNLSPLIAPLSLSHSVALSSLSSSTLYNYRVMSKDVAGNASVSPNFTFTTLMPPDTSPPLVSVTYPADGAVVSGTVQVTADASDNQGVAGVQFEVDGMSIGPEDREPPYTIQWNTAANTNNSHKVRALAKDVSGNIVSSASIIVTADNPLSNFPWPTHVSSNGRYLVGANGNAFFWLGDTAWMIPERANREDVEWYLQKRAEQGFTVIQVPVRMRLSIDCFCVHDDLSIYGDLPFVNRNVGEPNTTLGSDPGDPEQYDWWDHLDYIVEAARAKGIAVALGPYFVWNSYTGTQDLTISNAYGYGRFLGERYGGKPNVFWFLGGDDAPKTSTEIQVWREVARGITEAVAGSDDYSKTLMTYHLNGEFPFSSSAFLHGEEWLDFNMIQTWSSMNLIQPTLASDYAKSPAKPTGLGEGAYEDGPQYPVIQPVNALKIRRQAYWSYFAGGYHTYGNTNTWNFGTHSTEVTQDWKIAMDSPGALSLKILQDFFTSREWWKLVPDQSMFESGVGSGMTLNTAARSSDGTWAAAYISSPTTFSINLSKLESPWLSAAWINPKTGQETAIGTFQNTGTEPFTTPSGWEDALIEFTPAAPPDTIPPSVPGNLAALPMSPSRIDLSWEASTDDTEVSGYKIYRNGSEIVSVTSLSYSDTGLQELTEYSYAVAAFDAFENLSAQSAPAAASTPAAPDATPPAISVTAPGQDETVSGALVPLHASASDARGVVGVTFYIDSEQVGEEDTESPYTMIWDSTAVSSGSHFVTAVARDEAGNSATSSEISFIVDNAAPIISAVSSNAEAFTAMITWTTDEAGDSQVEYGTTTEYGSVTSLDPSLTTSHSVLLSGLVSETAYNFRIISKDGEGNEAVSENFTFMTTIAPDILPPEIEITSPLEGEIASGTIMIFADATDDRSVSGVQFQINGENFGIEDTIEPYGIFWDTAETVNGSYSLTAIARDGEGNIATSSSVTVSVLNPDAIPPIISSITLDSLEPTSAAISWTTDEETQSEIEFGIAEPLSSVSGTSTSFATSHLHILANLEPSTTYLYRITARDGAGNATTSETLTFTTPELPDTTAPSIMISTPEENQTVMGIVLISVTASDDKSVSGIQFMIGDENFGSEDTVSPYGIFWDTTGVENGIYTLSGVARDEAGNVGVSAPIVVIVNNPDITPPVISGVQSSNVGTSTALIAWATDEAGDSQVEYGTTTEYGDVSAIDSSLMTDHSISISDLSPSTTYHYRVISRDEMGNMAASLDETFTTLALPPPDLLLYLPFDEGSGETAFDASGRDNHGTLVNDPTWTLGKISAALSFDGANDYVEVANSAAIELGAADWTFAAWANVTAFNKTRPLLSKSAPDTWAFPGKKIELGSRGLIFDAFNVGQWFSNRAVSAGVWNHFAITFDNETNQVRMYINGELDRVLTANLPPDNPSHVIRVGNRGAEWMYGKIDDVRIYDRVLSAEEIAALAQ